MAGAYCARHLRLPPSAGCRRDRCDWRACVGRPAGLNLRRSRSCSLSSRLTPITPFADLAATSASVATGAIVVCEAEARIGKSAGRSDLLVQCLSPGGKRLWSAGKPLTIWVESRASARHVVTGSAPPETRPCSDTDPRCPGTPPRSACRGFPADGRVLPPPRPPRRRKCP